MLETNTVSKKKPMKSLNNIIDQREQRIAELGDKWKN